jgi:hypothetical protein
MPISRTEPSDHGRDEQIHRLARQLNITPTAAMVDTARESWISATKAWRNGRGPKPDIARCITSAAAAASRVEP